MNLPPAYASLVDVRDCFPGGVAPLLEQGISEQHVFVGKTQEIVASNRVKAGRKMTSPQAPASSMNFAAAKRLASKDKTETELTISLADNFCFVYPTNQGRQSTDVADSEEDEAPGSSSVAQKPHFIVTLTFAVPEGSTSAFRLIEELEVKLYAKETLGSPQGLFEYNKPDIASKIVAEARGFELVPGSVHQFETLIDVPNTVAAYDWGRYGSFSPRLSAKAKLTKDGQAMLLQKAHSHSGFSVKQSFLDMAASALPRSKTIKAEESVYMISVPCRSNILDYARTHHTAAEHLGPIAAHARTEHLTVGGYIRLGLSLPAPEPGLQISQIAWNIVQQTSLHSRRSTTVSKCPVERRNILTLGGEDLQESLDTTSSIGSSPSDRVSSLLRTWTARLPADDLIRPTTLEGAKDTAIRISHQLELRITFQAAADVAKPERPRSVFVISWPLTIASCLCKWRTLKLPPYSAEDPCPTGDAATTMASMVRQRAMVVDQWRRGNAPVNSVHLFCACGSALEELLVSEAQLATAQGAPSPQKLVESALVPSLGELAGVSSIHDRRSSSAESNVNGGLGRYSDATAHDVTQHSSQAELLDRPAAVSPSSAVSRWTIREAEEQRQQIAAKAQNEYRPVVN